MYSPRDRKLFLISVAVCLDRPILDAISAVEKEQIVFEFKDSLSPGVIKTVEDEGYCCVIMPMRI